MGDTQTRILDVLKRGEATTVPTIARMLGLSAETVRGHMRALRAEGLVARQGTRGRGSGRPQIVYGLTDSAEALFPQRGGALLRDLAGFLQETGNEALLHEFFDRHVADRRAHIAPRLEGLQGIERMREVARILSEEGFMATVEEDEPGDAGARARLRLCHCPMRELVSATSIPCRAEIGFVRDLLAEPMARVEYIPAGDSACTYAVPTGPSACTGTAPVATPPSPEDAA